MIIFVVFFAAVAVLRCAADDSVTTSLLLPGGLFSEDSFQKPTFVGQVTVTRSTTCYTIDCFAGGAATYFYPGNIGCSDSSYTFTEISASTQYLVQDELVATAAAATSAAATSTDGTIFITSVSCNR